MSFKRKIKIYQTREIEEGTYATKTSTQEISDKDMPLVERVRIEEVNCNEDILEFSLKYRKDYVNYVLFGNEIISTFLKDMQVLDNEKAVSELKGRTLNGIFNNRGEFAALGIDFYKREVDSKLIERLMLGVQRRKNEYNILKKNNKLKEEDYFISNELEKLGLLNLNKKNNSTLSGYDSVNGKDSDSDMDDKEDDEDIPDEDFG